jgi:hypothetical protein
MKTSKYIAAGLLFMLGSGISLQAQDTIINRNVSVEREYRPVIQDAGKINSVPKVLELTVEKATAKFSDFNLPLDAGFNIHTLSAAELATDKPVNKEGYARIGIGSYLNSLIDFAYPVINQPDMRLDFSFNHLGTFESKRLHNTTKTALSFDKLFKTFDLYAGLGGGYEHFKYYGDNFDGNGPVDLSKLVAPYGSYDWNEVSRAGVNTTPRSFKLDSLAGFPKAETFWRFNSFAGMRSLPLSPDLRYQAEINYSSFSANNGLNESIVHTKAKFNSPIDENRMGLDFDLYNMLYGSNKIQAFNFWKNYSVLALNPYYSIERPDWNVRIGVKTSLSFVHGKLANPSPDVRGEWNAIPKYLSLYGALTGDYEVNTLNKTFFENPYLFSDIRVNDTYTPYEFVIGVKVKPLYNLLVDGYIDMRQIDKQYFYVNKEYQMVAIQTAMFPPIANSYLYTNRFNVIYSDASLVKLGIRANYNLQNFLNVELKYAVNNWSVDNEAYAWNKPKNEMQLNTNVRIDPNFSVSGSLYYEGGRYAKLGSTAVKMNDKVDVNLGVSYNYLNWFTAFVKLNNVLNKHYQDYYGYDVQGANVMVGAAFSF